MLVTVAHDAVNGMDGRMTEACLMGLDRGLMGGLMGRIGFEM